jgi:CRP-like cAMP-binding protein
VSGSRTRSLRDKLNQALRKERLGEALGHYEALQVMEQSEPRWPHRKGDLLKRLGREAEAVEAYERAVDLYAQQGFVARAAAMAKVVLAIAPERMDILDRVTTDAARKLRRSAHHPATHTKRYSVDALPLVADKTAEDDLLRFTTPPAARHRTLELDISDAEVQDRPTPIGGVSERPTAEHLAQLPSMPLFAEVPKEVLAKLLQESRLIDLEPGEHLIERGTTADALYSLVEGSVQLIRSVDEDVIVLAEGDVVGISSLLQRVNYEGDVTARTKVRALRISKLLLDRLVAHHPGVGDVLLEVLGRRLVATLVRTSPMFSSFDNGTRTEVAGMFEVRQANQGTVILEAGKRADGLYIPMIGELTAIRPSGEELGHLKLGRALGQHSMLTRSTSQMTVQAASDVLLLRLSARRFRQLVSEHPKMVVHLEELARRPSAPTFSLIPEPWRKSGA